MSDILRQKVIPLLKCITLQFVSNDIYVDTLINSMNKDTIPL